MIFEAQIIAGDPESAEGASECTAEDLLILTRKELSRAGIEDAGSESYLLLEWICGIDKGTYFAEPKALIPAKTVQKYLSFLKKRTDRIPLQYLMNSCEFMGYSFYVDERVLIPRQDTECLVEQAIHYIKERQEAGRKPCSCRILDLCTGSGCIGISLKKLCPQTEVTLADISGQALTVAGYNAHNLSAGTELVQSDLFENIHKQYDLIVSNPPYIPSKVIDTLMPEVRDYEPRLALDGEDDGLAFYRRILREAADYLLPEGWLMFEIGMDQGEDLKKMFHKEGYKNVRIFPDLTGRDRIAAGQRNIT